MNLKNKKIEELWDMLDKILENKELWFRQKPKLHYDIHKEIIRREKSK